MDTMDSCRPTKCVIIPKLTTEMALLVCSNGWHVPSGQQNSAGTQGEFPLAGIFLTPALASMPFLAIVPVTTVTRFFPPVKWLGTSSLSHGAQARAIPSLGEWQLHLL